MAKIPFSLLALGAVAGVLVFNAIQVRNPKPFPSGSIQLRITNPTCAAVSPQSTNVPNINPSYLNDGKLDSFETAALNEGCTIQAVAIAPNGMLLTDVILALVRTAATGGKQEFVGTTRRTDDYGSATWTFRLAPNTDFKYEVISPNPVGQTVRSNPIEIQLCTGPESVSAIPNTLAAEAGRGCP